MAQTMKYIVATDKGNGISVFEADKKQTCVQYIEQAIKKGSKPGYLAILTESDWLRNRGE